MELVGLADVMRQVGERLQTLGALEASLRGSLPAVERSRELADGAPESFLADIASALHSLGGHHSALGHREQALQATQEAVGLYRQLVATRSRAFVPQLARALHDLSNYLGVLGHRDQALHAAQEVVDLYRQLSVEGAATPLVPIAEDDTNPGQGDNAAARSVQVHTSDPDGTPSHLGRIEETPSCARVRVETPFRVEARGHCFWLRTGERIDLRRRGATRRILAHLLEAHAARPGSPVPPLTLQCAGWPGERLLGRSGRARLHVAVCTLRKLGLGNWIVFREGGYLLDPDVDVQVLNQDN